MREMHPAIAELKRRSRAVGQRLQPLDVRPTNIVPKPPTYRRSSGPTGQHASTLRPYPSGQISQSCTASGFASTEKPDGDRGSQHTPTNFADATSEEERQREFVFHVCKIIVETVEDYVQHSGIIWRVIIVTSDENSLKSSMLCREILEVTQMAKTRVEVEERQRMAAGKRVSSTPSDTGITAQEEVEGEEEHGENKEKEAKGGAEKTLTEPAAATRALTTAVVAMAKSASHKHGPFEDVARFSESIRDRAARCGVRISDAELYPIFLALSGGEDTVPISEIVQLILEKELELNDGRRSKLCRETRLIWPHDHPICALDSCGVPCDKTTVWNFVKSFQRRPYRANVGGYMATIGFTPGNAPEPPESLNYVEFSVLMLALARQ